MKHPSHFGAHDQISSPGVARTNGWSAQRYTGLSPPAPLPEGLLLQNFLGGFTGWGLCWDSTSSSAKSTFLFLTLVLIPKCSLLNLPTAPSPPQVGFQGIQPAAAPSSWCRQRSNFRACPPWRVATSASLLPIGVPQSSGTGINLRT